MHFTGGEIIPRRVLCPWRAHLLASTLPAIDLVRGAVESTAARGCSRARAALRLGEFAKNSSSPRHRVPSM